MLLEINSSCRVCSAEFHRSKANIHKIAYCSFTCYGNRGTTIVPKCHPEREHRAHGLCNLCYQREYVEKNKAGVQAKKRAYRAKNPKRTLGEYLTYEYGLSIEQWEALLSAQNGLCAICQGPPVNPYHRLVVDHDHATGTVRGLLCGHCNNGIGYLKDDIRNLQAALSYLQDHANTTTNN